MDKEDKANKAFDFLIITFAKHMKSKGATDEEIQSFMGNALCGMMNTIQDHKGFSNRVYGIINECCEESSISDMRSAGMKCEIIDQIESALENKINDALGYNNVIDLTAERIRRVYGIEKEVFEEAILDLLRKGDFD